LQPETKHLREPPAWTCFPARALVSGWNEGDHLAAAAAGFDLAAMGAAISTDPDRYELIIEGNKKDHAASGHWGVPTFVFENEPFFGQGRIGLLIWRMENKGLTRRG
jgi:2-hydroxychromene-2-carboxylate isomerase